MDNHPQASQDAPLNVDSSFPSPYRTAQEVDIEPTSAVEAPSTEVPSTETVEVPAAATVAKPGPFAGLPMRIQEALTKRGFTDLTPVQRAVVAAGVANRQLQISSQTGSGKTVALGIVLADHLEKHEQNTRGPEALIIVPTRELANQVCEELGWLLAGYPGSRVTSVTGGTPMHRDRHSLGRRPRVLVGTPGRLLDHVRSGVLDLSGVRELVLDEADQMLDMGFREELEGILDATPETRSTHLVSATFPEGIRSLAMRYQRDPVVIEGTPHGSANDDIDHVGYLVHQRDRYATLVNLLLLAAGERTLVFVERRADAIEVASRLEEDGFAALPLSGELAQSQRERTMAAFRSGRTTVLVATDVAARGLDVPDVAAVVQTSLPIDGHIYTHRSGRTGRAGKRGRSVLFVPPNRRRKAERLVHDARVELQWADVPGADEVRGQLLARGRARLDERIAVEVEAGPAERHLAHARDLLETHDAATLVASLVSNLEPTQKAEPQDVSQPRFDDRGPRHDDRGHADRGGYGERPRNFQGRSNERGGPSGGAVRFFMNFGANQGASPGRLLAAVCRRGEVQGTDIGSIAIHPNASTFDVRPEVAENFERLAGRRDSRDPQTIIRRDRGPAAGGGGAPYSGGARRGGGKFRGRSARGYGAGAPRQARWSERSMHDSRGG